MKYADDVLAAIGVGLLSYGAWMIYQPAAFVTGGALLLAAALLRARSQARGATRRSS